MDKKKEIILYTSKDTYRSLIVIGVLGALFLVMLWSLDEITIKHQNGWVINTEFLFFAGIMSVVWTATIISMFISSKKGLAKVRILDNGYQMFLFKNDKHCYIDKNKKIYYMIFMSTDHSYKLPSEYIIFSHEPVRYKKTTLLKGDMLSQYDIWKEIVLPYDNQTKQYLDIENWEEVPCVIYRGK